MAKTKAMKAALVASAVASSTSAPSHSKGAPKLLGPVVSVPSASIWWNEEWNARHSTSYEGKVEKDKELVSDESISSLGESIKKEGQTTPSFVVELSNVPPEWKRNAPKGATYFGVAGFRRGMAIKIAGVENTLVRVCSAGYGPQDLRLLNLGENIARRDLSTYDLATGCTSLSEMGMSGNEIGKALSAQGGGKVFSKQYVNNLIRQRLVLIPEILEGWATGAPWATQENIKKAATYNDLKERSERGDTSPYVISEENRAAQLECSKTWPGSFNAEEPGDAGTEGDAATEGGEGDTEGAGTEEEASIPKPSKANVKKAIAVLATLSDAEEAGSVEGAAFRTARVALLWTLGLDRNEKPLAGDTLGLRIAGKLAWSTKTASTEKKAAKAEREGAEE